MKGRKFHRETAQRKAMLRTMATSLIMKEKIKTGEAKAKELSGYVEKKITRAKKGDLAASRYLAKFFCPRAVSKLVKEVAPKYKDRAGGYTRIVKLGPRKTDGAKMAIIELV
ncbi:MAG: 50S ribosomal protein L17 [Candidatus Paceibacterota bacterium]|nr:50S ribosomal protein L17 [Candidatus Paceibacterota bacterium]MDD4831123.1 50S ribosomal protein L17 [Candidatus Paceibacterota bacterium]MDD4875001.1 50S ribosomal protein L17 [Candidatus Paceibacterota bacterium]